MWKGAGLNPAEQPLGPRPRQSPTGIGLASQDTHPGEKGSCVLEPQDSLPLPQHHGQACGWHIPFQEEATAPAIWTRHCVGRVTNCKWKGLP